MNKFLLPLLLFCLVQIQAQNMDSVRWYQAHIPTLKHDTSRIVPMVRMAGHYGAGSDSAFFYVNKALGLAEKYEIQKYRGFALNTRGGFYYRSGQYEEAILDIESTINIYQRIGETDKYLSTMTNLAILNRRTGNLPKSLEINQVLLAHYREEQDTVKAIGILNNLGNLYSDIGDQTAALSYHHECLQWRKKINDYVGLVTTYSNIGNVYDNLKKLDSALFFFYEALGLVDHVKGTHLESNVYNNIGVIYAAMDSLDIAENYYLRGLEIREILGDYHGITQAMVNLSSLYFKKGNYTKAKDFGKQAYELSEQFGYLDEKKRCALQLSLVFEKTNDFTSAYNFLKIHMHIKDSLERVNNKMEFARKEFSFMYDQQRLQDSLRVSSERQLEQVEFSEQKKRQQLYVWIGVICSLGLLVILFFVYQGYKTKSAANKIITTQKEAIQRKNEEIVDSINYAKRIQSSILPPLRDIRAAFPESFVLYLPKDVVSGDFYWYEELGDTHFLAAADCTGHGVPGAMVSVVCHQALHKVLIEEHITDTGLLLDRVRTLIVQQLQRSGENIKDGMDISLVSVRFSNESENGERHYDVQWSGANNPIWIIKPNPSGGVDLSEIKADKQPIGIYDNPKPFTAHQLSLKSNDRIYLLTDGLQDQFGGPKGKKLKPANLKNWLLDNVDLSMDNQRNDIETRFNNWKGDQDQVDDICVIGLKL
jgi:tetratricopeptide (TPR) repeat protein